MLAEGFNPILRGFDNFGNIALHIFLAALCQLYVHHITGNRVLDEDHLSIDMSYGIAFSGNIVNQDLLELLFLFLLP